MVFRPDVLDDEGRIRVVYGWDPDGNTIELLPSAPAPVS